MRHPSSIMVMRHPPEVKTTGSSPALGVYGWGKMYKVLKYFI